jgi:integrase
VTGGRNETDGSPTTALVPEWMDHYFPTVEPTTRDFYIANTRYIVAELGPLPLSSLPKYRVNEFLRDLKTRNTAIPRPLSTTAKRAVRRTLAMVIDYAMQFHPEMTLTTNPAREAKAPQATKAETDDEADQRWFDDNEVQQFFKAVHAIERKNADTPTPLHVGAAWAIQYHLGLRPGEARALSWSDIEDASDTPTIYVGHGQKRSGGTTIARGTTKTRDSRRKLYVPLLTFCRR